MSRPSGLRATDEEPKSSSRCRMRIAFVSHMRFTEMLHPVAPGNGAMTVLFNAARLGRPVPEARL